MDEISSSRSPEQKAIVYVHNSDQSTVPNSKLIEVIEEVTGRGASIRFYATGWSMSPFIRNGDILTIQPPTGHLSIGDVVAFKHPKSGRLTVHRIIRVNNGAYEIKGDNTEYCDGLVSSANILGKVSMVKRMNRRVYLGMGFEKFIIAQLSRTQLLLSINRTGYSVIKLLRRIITCR